jgi:hypothetical protein
MECLNISDPNTVYERSENITIPKKSSFEDFTKLDEYKLTSNNFDPTKASPPNKWNNRLQQRINNYFTEYEILKIPVSQQFLSSTNYVPIIKTNSFLKSNI